MSGARTAAVYGRAGLALALFAWGGLSGAEEVRVRAPSPPRAPAPAPAAVGEEARSLAARGRYADAIALLEDAVRRGPYDERLHYDLGELMTGHASPEEMIRFFSAEAVRDEKPQTSHYFWAIGLARGGNPDGAIGQLREALDIDPAHEMSQRLWGAILEQEGRLEPAYEHFLESTRIHPEYRQALLDAARVARKLGRASEAEDLERRALSANPGTPRCFFYWARYLHAHGRDDAALAEIARGLAAIPGDPETLRLRDAILRGRSPGGR